MRRELVPKHKGDFIMFWTLLCGRQPRSRTAQRRRKLVAPIECLEERLSPDASFFPLVTGPLLQNWSTAPITADNDWSTVPSIIGYNGAGLAPVPGTDPQTILADGTNTAMTVLSNQTDPSSLPPVGIAEFSTLSKPTVALAADGTDQAPFLLVNLDTSQTRNVRVKFNLRDLVLPASSVAEPFALQYRLGTSGDFTNLTTGFVGDATNGANPGNLVTPVSVTLPGEAYDQPQLQLRIITTNPTGTARWIAVDDLQVTGTTTPLRPLMFAFSIDSVNSSLSLSGDVDGSPIQPQGAGSLTTSYSGTIAAVWDREAGTINFLAATSDAVAANSGSWQPLPGGGGGSAPANYGGQVNTLFVTGRAALREMHAALSTSTPLTLTGFGPYNFASTQTVNLTHGFGDYNAGFQSGSVDFSNFSANNTSATPGTLEDLGGGTYRLTMPIDGTITGSIGFGTSHLHVQGTLVANVTLPVDPSLPVVDLNGSSPGLDNLAGFVQGGLPVLIAPNVTATDAASPNLTTAVVTLTNRPNGTAESLAADVGGTGLTASYSIVTGRLTISGAGALATYQAVLQTVTYRDNAGPIELNAANRLIEVTVSDGADFSPIRTAVVTVAAARAALVNTVPAAQSTSVDTPLTFSSAGGNALSVGDPNPRPGGFVQVMLSVTNGTLTLASTSGLTIMAGGNGTATITIRGTLADINAALDGLVYTPGLGFTGSDALTILSDDLWDTDATGAAHHRTTLSTVAISVQ
jgi:hypothetical protein